MQDINQLRAMIKAIPATREGNEKLAMLANDPDPMKRMLAGIEANNRVRTRAQRQAEQGQQQQGRRPVVQEKMDELMQAGIGGLDVGEDMYGQGMAAGGIVAFDQGGGVNTEDPLNQLSGLDMEGMGADQARISRDEARVAENLARKKLEEDRIRYQFLRQNAPETAAKMLAANPLLNPEAAKTVVAANPAAPAANPAKPNAAKPNAPAANPNTPAANPNQPPAQQDPFSIMQAYLKGDAAERAAARKDAKNMAMLETGLAMYGGDSPYANVNIGQAGARGTRSYGERVAGLRTEERNVGKSLADLELKRYELNQAKDLGELQRKTQKEVAGIYASARGSDDKTRAGIIKNATAAVDKQLLTDRAYSKLKTPEEKAQYRKKLITQEVSNYGLDMAGGAGKSWEGWSGGPQG
jgi:hypothetical protein